MAADYEERMKLGELTDETLVKEAPKKASETRKCLRLQFEGSAITRSPIKRQLNIENSALTANSSSYNGVFTPSAPESLKSLKRLMQGRIAK